MIVTYNSNGTSYIQINTTMTAEEWQHVQFAFLDVTTDLMNGKLSEAGKNGVANLMQLLKDMMLDEKQTTRALQDAA